MTSKRLTYVSVLLLISQLTIHHVFASHSFNDIQDTIATSDTVQKKDCLQKDIRDLFRKKSKPPKPPKRTSLLIIPSVAANPANGFMVNLGGNAGWYFGNKEETNVSFAGFTVTITTKEQLLTFLKTNIYTPKNKFYLQGDWRYYIYSIPTYGLGTNSPDTGYVSPQWYWQGADVNEAEGGYPMEYYFLKVHQTASYELAENVYAGIGYHLDKYWDIRDRQLRLDTLPFQLTPHYAYSLSNGFDTSGYTLSGLSLNFFYDSRDNLINSYEGYYFNFNYRFNPTWLGSDQSSSQLWVEYRSFHSLSQKRPRHLIAIWLFGNFLLSGKQPYMTLMATAEDQKARSGRGYVQGRYRGEDFIYGELEYRFPIIPCSQVLGGVLFVNATTASHRATGVHLFDYIRPSAGFGLRLMFSKHVRTNINFEMGFGFRSSGIYFSGAETF